MKPTHKPSNFNASPLTQQYHSKFLQTTSPTIFSFSHKLTTSSNSNPSFLLCPAAEDRSAKIQLINPIFDNIRTTEVIIRTFAQRPVFVSAVKIQDLQYYLQATQLQIQLGYQITQIHVIKQCNNFETTSPCNGSIHQIKPEQLRFEFGGVVVNMVEVATRIPFLVFSRTTQSYQHIRQEPKSVSFWTLAPQFGSRELASLIQIFLSINFFVLRLQCQVIMLIIVKMQKQQIEQSEEFQHLVPAKSKYTKTSMKKKQMLIDMVLSRNFSIYRASKKLKISNSTAKSIITNYSKHGTILERNTKHEIQKISTFPLKQESQHVLYQTFKDDTLVKQEQPDYPTFPFNEQDRLQIMRKMGICPQTYPFLQGPFPFIYQTYQT